MNQSEKIDETLHLLEDLTDINSTDAWEKELMTKIAERKTNNRTKRITDNNYAVVIMLLVIVNILVFMIWPKTNKVASGRREQLQTISDQLLVDPLSFK
jgi:hypothetical protein